MAPAAGLEPATRRLTGGWQPTQDESLRQDAPHEGRRDSDPDPPCFTVRRDDSSRNVTDEDEEYNETIAAPAPIRQRPLALPVTSDEALRLAIKLAIDENEFERARELLDILDRKSASATVMPIEAGRAQRPRR